jgi:2-keto-4-pentenoate hydratase/2-oxohepta-3-ene-1,7-dioic acid hydratase in catechol pathway
MKLVSYRDAQGETFGLVRDGAVVNLGRLAGGRWPTLRAALEGSALDRLADAASGAAPAVAFDDADLLPVIPLPEKVICVGLNYATHIAEGGREPPKYPMLFPRWARSQVAHGKPIVVPKASEKLDFEGEMAFVVGKAGRHVPRGRAFEHVAGYACYNDGSVRDWQRHTGQFMPGKNFEETGGFGPWLVTPDEVADLGACELITRLNGEVMQHARLDDLVFGVPELIEYVTTFITLVPGDVVVTGTTGGVGAYREPPVWMKEGDVCEVEVTGIGTLRNPLRNEA